MILWHYCLWRCFFSYLKASWSSWIIERLGYFSHCAECLFVFGRAPPSTSICVFWSVIQALCNICANRRRWPEKKEWSQHFNWMLRAFQWTTPRESGDPSEFGETDRISDATSGPRPCLTLQAWVLSGGGGGRRWRWRGVGGGTGLSSVECADYWR